MGQCAFCKRCGLRFDDTCPSSLPRVSHEGCCVKPCRLSFKMSAELGAVMRSLTVLLSFLVVNGFAATSSASEKVRLAQTSVTTTCMMTCNAQYALCQSNCLSVGVTSTTPTTGVNPNPNQTCRASCTNQQLACQITCARTISN